jgi:serine phosphatase RsbU (regulator of sigma subunit)
VDPEAVYHVQWLTLEPADRLVLVSDGVLEAAPKGGLAYGAGRLDALLRTNGELAAYEVVRRVIREVIAHRAGDLADDLAVVCLIGADHNRDRLVVRL